MKELHSNGGVVIKRLLINLAAIVDNLFRVY